MMSRGWESVLNRDFRGRLKTAMEIFVAFGPYNIEVRSYVGGHPVSHTLSLGESLRQAAGKLSTALGLAEPIEARVASTYMGVTLICEIDGRGQNARCDDIVRFAKHQGWKLSRK